MPWKPLALPSRRDFSPAYDAAKDLELTRTAIPEPRTVTASPPQEGSSPIQEQNVHRESLQNGVERPFHLSQIAWGWVLQNQEGPMAKKIALWSIKGIVALPLFFLTILLWIFDEIGILLGLVNLSNTIYQK